MRDNAAMLKLGWVRLKARPAATSGMRESWSSQGTFESSWQMQSATTTGYFTRNFRVNLGLIRIHMFISTFYNMKTTGYTLRPADIASKYGIDPSTEDRVSICPPN